MRVENDRAPPARARRGAGQAARASGNVEAQYSNDAASRLLNRLDRVHETGPGRWLACCPSHEDGTPSLSIRVLDDGTVLLHCFAGCSAADVVAAVGLELSDLFPDRPGGHRRRPTRPGERWVPRDVLKTVADESLFVMIVAEAIARGESIDEAERDRLATAHARLREAARTGGCHV